MKRLVALAMVVTMGLSGLVGCTGTGDKTVDQSTETEVSSSVEESTQEEKSEVEEVAPNAKVAVNISGTIEEISEDGTKIRVNDQWVIITEDTRFEDDPDNGVETVSKELKVGNDIQGWTSDETDAEEVTAEVIYSNN